MDLDHAVLWVESAERALKFYVDVLGLAPVRAQEFEEGTVRFPSVRVNEATVFDLMERGDLLSRVKEFTGGGDRVGGDPINHLCLASCCSPEGLRARLRTARVVSTITASSAIGRETAESAATAPFWQVGGPCEQFSGRPRPELATRGNGSA